MAEAIPPERLPPEVRAFVELLHLDVVDEPVKVLPPGFKAPAWLIPVRDEGTGETVGILNAYPPLERERYAIITITNKLGRPVTVITFREEAERVAPPPPELEEVERTVARTREEVEAPPPPPLPVDWGWMRQLASRMASWAEALQRHVEDRNAVGCSYLLKSMREFAEEGRRRLLEAGGIVRAYEERRPEPKVLRPEEAERLWARFSEALRKAGVEPTQYRRRFEELIAWNLDYAGNELLVMDEARRIIDEHALLKGPRRAIPARAKFSWKYARWAASSLKLDAGSLLDAVRRADALQAYNALGRIAEAAGRLEEMLRPMVAF